MGIVKNYQSKGTCKVTFSYPANANVGVKTIQVLGEFNDWNADLAPKMKKSKDEYNTVLELEAGKTYQFRYLLDGAKWDNDFAADSYVQSPFMGISNSVIVLDELTQKPSATPKKQAVVTPKVASKSASAKITKSPAVKAKKVVAAKLAKTPVTQTTKISKDDLKKIEGIGPKIAEILSSKGIKTFADLSKAKADNLKKILDEAGPKFNIHDPATWSKQAALAAKGSWDELKKLQDVLNAGKTKK
ncbi:MAG: helix-hairpin-helix domain-containing protein [Saprospiraceae bacterium]|jgi:predicted flap endonuclease-1-like 5' DNA nuclease